MTVLLRAELLKLRTTRTFAALAGAALALSLLAVTVGASTQNYTQHPSDLHTLFTSDFTSAFILLLGAIGITGEWRHRTITGSILAAPDRVRLLAAKTFAYALVGVVLSLAVTAAIMLTGTLILESRDQPTLDLAGLADLLWRNLAVAALLGALGVAVGALVRNQVATVVGLLVLGLAVEPALVANLPEVGRLGPVFGAPAGILAGDHALLAPGLAALVCIAWASAAFASAAALLRRRDLI
jgi:ABC-type transport system involved in multi-copper enzyme maturation permease subunit